MGTQSQLSEPVVECPECGAVIPVTKAFTKQIEVLLSRRLQARFQDREKEIIQGYERRLSEATKKAAEQAIAAQAREHMAMREQLVEQKNLIDNLQSAEVELRRQKREVENQSKALVLEVERQVDERCKKIEQETTTRLSEHHRLKDLEKERQLGDLRRQLEEANRKANQGSQQLQGEIAEDDVVMHLRQTFSMDVIEKVNIAQRGADILQKIMDANGRHAGSILYEVKNTKSFAEQWTGKLREDQRAVGAEVAVIVTTSLPRDISTFADRAGVWVTGQPTWLSLAHALRFGIVEAGRARIVASGQAEKQAALVAYCSGVEFRQRIESLLDPLDALQQSLSSERKSVERWWAIRAKRYEQLLHAAMGLHGDVEGITGGLPKLKLEPKPGGEVEAA